VAWDAKQGQDWRRAEEVYLPWPPDVPRTDAGPLGDGVAETPMLRDLAGAVRHQAAPAQDVTSTPPVRHPEHRTPVNR
jgi:hypothetical protein